MGGGKVELKYNWAEEGSEPGAPKSQARALITAL